MALAARLKLVHIGDRERTAGGQFARDHAGVFLVRAAPPARDVFPYTTLFRSDRDRSAGGSIEGDGGEGVGQRGIGGQLLNGALRVVGAVGPSKAGGAHV